MYLKVRKATRGANINVISDRNGVLTVTKGRLFPRRKNVRPEVTTRRRTR